MLRWHDEARQTDAKRQERDQALADLEREREQLDGEMQQSLEDAMAGLAEIDLGDLQHEQAVLLSI